MQEQDNPLLREILDQATELPPGERSAFLDSACNGNRQMRAEIESLLASLDSKEEAGKEP